MAAEAQTEELCTFYVLRRDRGAAEEMFYEIRVDPEPEKGVGFVSVVTEWGRKGNSAMGYRIAYEGPDPAPTLKRILRRLKARGYEIVHQEA